MSLLLFFPGNIAIVVVVFHHLSVGHDIFSQVFLAENHCVRLVVLLFCHDVRGVGAMITGVNWGSRHHSAVNFVFSQSHLQNKCFLLHVSYVTTWFPIPIPGTRGHSKFAIVTIGRCLGPVPWVHIQSYNLMTIRRSQNKSWPI